MNDENKICGNCVYREADYPLNSRCAVNGKIVSYYHKCDCIADEKNGVLSFHQKDLK